jgi:signal transduction histidine kinase
VDLTAYRIIQEALTNTAKHAAGQAARVRLDYGGARLLLTVTNDGPPLPPPAPGAGYGLTGMRERAHSVGGELRAGPRPEGGFQVAATLPVPPEARQEKDASEAGAATDAAASETPADDPQEGTP